MRASSWFFIAALAVGCSDYGIQGEGDDDATDPGDDDTTEIDPPEECDAVNWPAEEVGVADDTCTPPTGGFDPIVEWSYQPGGGCLSLPTVGDLDGDGQPEIALNLTNLMSAPGELHILRGDGSGPLWTDPAASLGYAVSPALGDLDGDGFGEVVAVKEYATSMWGGAGDYTVVAYSHTGAVLWESEHFYGYQVDFQAAPSISDMDHDGSPEIVVGRAILNADGSLRGLGAAPGASASFMIPAVTDLDLDGIEEVIGGDAWYDASGATVWENPLAGTWGGLMAVANLDADPEGEVIATLGEETHAFDTDGSPLWVPPVTVAPGQLASAPAIGDLDGDGMVEVVVAGGNALHCLNHDGSVLWTAAVTDLTGATGASIFDFEGDGVPEVVYIDEVEILVFDGPTGTLKYHNDEHSSNTMWDYPVIADVDGDDRAEIVVCHNSLMFKALSVFGALDDNWAPSRPVWNQHAYSIGNVNDDLSIPDEPPPSFTDHNTWHSALATTWDALGIDLWAEILEVCCEEDQVFVTVRVLNRGYEDVDAGVKIALYAVGDGLSTVVDTSATPAAIPSGWASDAIEMVASLEDLVDAGSISVVADDDGTGTGAVAECSEENNYDQRYAPLCE